MASRNNIILNRGGVPMSSVEFTARLTTNNVVQQDPITGALEVGGATISGIAAYTFAQLSAMTTEEITNLGGIYLICSDKFSEPDGSGSVRFLADVTAQRLIFDSDHVYFSSFSALPAAASWKGMRCVFPLWGTLCKVESRLVGSDWLWRVVGNHHPAFSAIADIPKTGTMTAQEILKQIIIPRNPNTTIASVAGQSFLQPGDSFLFRVAQQKTGSADFMNIKILCGTAGTTSDQQIGAASAANGIETGAIGHTSQGVVIDITMRSKTSMLLNGPASGIQWNGGSTGTSLVTPTTVSDANQNDMYLSLTSQTRAGAGTDTALLIRTLEIDYHGRGG